MQRLNTLWQMVSAASTVKEVAQRTKTYQFAVPDEQVTFYLRAENSSVQVFRWSRPLIEVTVKLNGAFGWRIAAEQDEAGVYVAAKRRVMVGGLSSARFEVRVPLKTYLVLKLEACALKLEHINGTLHLPPLDGVGETLLKLED